MVLEFDLSFSTRSYPTVRKCTEYFLVSMSTNMLLKIRTRCYSFVPFYVRKYKCIWFLIRHTKRHYISGLSGTAVVLLLCELSRDVTISPPHSRSRLFTRCGASTRDDRREATAAAAGVVVRCCCCRGLGTRTHTKPVPLTYGIGHT